MVVVPLWRDLWEFNLFYAKHVKCKSTAPQVETFLSDSVSFAKLIFSSFILYSQCIFLSHSLRVIINVAPIFQLGAQTDCFSRDPDCFSF